MTTKESAVSTPPMFELPDQPKPPAVSRPQLAHHKPKWTPYRPKNPVKCDHCMQVLAENRGQSPATRDARHRRKAGGSNLLLCGPHSQEQRERDGLPKIKERRRR